MKLDELKLNRMMYRATPTAVTENPMGMSSEIYSRREALSKESAQKGKKDANEVITGTVITACLIKSSDQEDRVEIGQNLQAAIDQSDSPFRVGLAGGVDYFAAYRDGVIKTLITGQGNVYLNYVQPTQKWLNLENGQVIQNTSVPSNWTVTSIGTGEYRVTHNLRHLFYSVTVTPYSDVGWLGGAIAAVSEKTSTSFVINTFDDTGVAQDIDWNCVVQINPA